MGHRIIREPFATREAAEQHQKSQGIPGYSEFYPRGIDEKPATDGSVIFVSNAEEYYG